MKNIITRHPVAVEPRPTREQFTDRSGTLDQAEYIAALGRFRSRLQLEITHLNTRKSLGKNATARLKAFSDRNKWARTEVESFNKKEEEPDEVVS